MARDSRFPLSLPELERLCGAALCAVAPEGTILEAGPRARTLLGGGAGQPFPGPLREIGSLDMARSGARRS